MSRSGSSVHSEIREKISEVESQSEALTSKLYKFEQNLTSLTAERENCYVSLADIYSPEIDDPQAVKNTLRERRENVERIFREKQERRSDLEKLMNDNREENRKLEEEIIKTTAQIEQKVQERDKTSGLIAADLQKDANYTHRDEEAKKAETRLQQYKKRVEEVEGEARKKLPAFEQNKIFSYLLRIGYGTVKYHGSGLRQRLDNWAAEKVNFDENRKCYDFLKSMPEMMKEEVTRRQKDLDKVVLEMCKIELGVAEKYGLKKIISEGEKLLGQRKVLIGKDRREDEQYTSYAKERKEMDSDKDPYQIKVVQELKGFLKGEQIADLRARARKTKGTEDDKIVDRIDYIDTEVRGLKDKAKNSKLERDAVSEKLDELREIERRFRNNDYDGSRSYFSEGFDVNSLLAGYLLGHMSADDINHQIDSSQHTKAPEHHSSSSYSSSYSSSSHSSSSGFSSGSFSSGGGFGGGGFSSGSGF